jgi:probable O-glycosylation ligase (exosortase A-associated)
VKGLIFTYVLTYGGSLAALVNPFYGLLIYVCFAIIKPEALWHWSVPAGNYSRVIAVALLIGWAGAGFGRWDFGRAKLIVISLIGFLVWNAASAAMAADGEVAWNAVESLAKIVLPFVVGITLIDNVQQLKQLAWVIMLSQGYVAFEANMSYLEGNNWLMDQGFGGMDNNCIAIALVCATGFAFFLGLAETKTWRRWLAFFAAGLMAHAIMFSMSRGGMVALILTGVVSFLLIPKRPVYYAYLALAVAVGLMMAGPSVREEFATVFTDEKQRDESAQSRVVMWGHCVDLMLEEPGFGVGPKHFPLVVERFGFYNRGKEAHTLWLQTGAEVGAVGLGFLLAFYLAAMARCWVLARRLGEYNPDAANSCRMIIAALVGFMVAAQFVTLIGLELPYYVVLVGAGYLKLASRAEAYEAACAALEHDARAYAWSNQPQYAPALPA